jgi:hypothetical protein
LVQGKWVLKCGPLTGERDRQEVVHDTHSYQQVVQRQSIEAVGPGCIYEIGEKFQVVPFCELERTWVS